MKSIGIITLNGYYNYGNRLQNYALQEVLKSFDFQVETILVESVSIEMVNNINTAPSKIKRLKGKSASEIIGKIIKKIYYRTKKSEVSDSNFIRTEMFKSFTRKFINETDFIISEKKIPDKLNDRYNFFVSGSDQVWNPNYINGASVYFLSFASKFKRISYAPSFGVSEIPKEFKGNYRKWLIEMNHISVRENEGANIIKELTGRTAPVHLDPTLLLTKEKWLSISEKALNKPKGKYLLTYFLGGIPEEYSEQIKYLAKKNKLEVINMGNKMIKNTYRTGPSEFIDYINDCNIFCTDSFHGAVFSILFEKPFIVFDRVGSVSMYSRINTLLAKFELTSRKIENIKLDENLFKVDFSHVPAILETERIKALDYLKNALEIEKIGNES